MSNPSSCFLGSILPARATYSKVLEGFLGFCYLALSQVIIQTKIFVDVTSEWKSSLLFPATSEKRAFYHFQFDEESITYSLVLSVAGTMHYFVSDKHSWILLVPWIANCSFHWVTSSYVCLKNSLTSFETDDFWLTFGLMILWIAVKCLLLSEVIMNVAESLFKIVICNKELKSMVKGADEEDFADAESDENFDESSLCRLSEDLF